MNLSYPPFCFHRTSLLKMPSREKMLGAQRAKHAHFIAKRLVKRLGSHDHETRMHSTNRLLPPGSLKRTSLRKNFGGWAKRLCGSGRVLTKTLSKEVCFTLRQHFGLENPAPIEEVIRLHNLMKQARKRKLEVRKSATAMGDNVDTLPYEARYRVRHFLQSSCNKNCFNGHLCPAGILVRILGTSPGYWCFWDTCYHCCLRSYMSRTFKTYLDDWWTLLVWFIPTHVCWVFFDWLFKSSPRFWEPINIVKTS